MQKDLKWTGWRNNHPVLFFVGSFVGMMLLFYAFYLPDLFQRSVFTSLVNFYADVSSAVLNVFSFQTSVRAGDIVSDNFSVSIRMGCDAAEPMGLFIAGIIAFPALLRKKIIGLCAGLVFLFALNIIRIITLFLFGLKYPDLFETMHSEIWQIIFILITIAIWFVWLKWTLRKPVKA